ncbi:POLO box domain [Trinorchestia longiramus]|nr:POLO box domain [Trinorchestia longiramus]
MKSSVVSSNRSSIPLRTPPPLPPRSNSIASNASVVSNLSQASKISCVSQKSDVSVTSQVSSNSNISALSNCSSSSTSNASIVNNPPSSISSDSSSDSSFHSENFNAVAGSTSVITPSSNAPPPPPRIIPPLPKTSHPVSECSNNRRIISPALKSNSSSSTDNARLDIVQPKVIEKSGITRDSSQNVASLSESSLQDAKTKQSVSNVTYPAVPARVKPCKYVNSAKKNSSSAKAVVATASERSLISQKGVNGNDYEYSTVSNAEDVTSTNVKENKQNTRYIDDEKFSNLRSSNTSNSGSVLAHQSSVSEIHKNTSAGSVPHQSSVTETNKNSTAPLPALLQQIMQSGEEERDCMVEIVSASSVTSTAAAPAASLDAGKVDSKPESNQGTSKGLARDGEKHCVSFDPLLTIHPSDGGSPLKVGGKDGRKPSDDAQRQPTQAQGGEDCYLKELYAQVSAVVASCPDEKAVINEDETEDPAAVPMVWISKWVDYSDKYGLGYQLCDDSIGVLFNDFTKLQLLPDGENIHYIERNLTEHYHTLSVFPQSLYKKVTLLRYFRNYMNEHLLKAGATMCPREGDELARIPSLRTYFRTRSAIVLHLTNGTLQMNFFEDHTKVILCPLMGAVTYIDQQRNFRTFKLALIQEHGCSADLASRLKYARNMIQKMMVSRSHTDSATTSAAAVSAAAASRSAKTGGGQMA